MSDIASQINLLTNLSLLTLFFDHMKVKIAESVNSQCRVKASNRAPIRVALVQSKWHSDIAILRSALADGIRLAASNGAEIVFLPELTLSKYPADTIPIGYYEYN